MRNANETSTAPGGGGGIHQSNSQGGKGGGWAGNVALSWDSGGGRSEAERGQCVCAGPP